MATNKIYFVILILFAIALCGCKNSEEKARELHNQAITASREGRDGDAVMALDEIVKKYPSTQTAIEANKALASRDALADLSNKTKKETINMALHLYKLDNGKYPTTEQGVRSLAHSPVTGEVPKKWRAGGYVEKESILEIVESYESDGNTYKLTCK